MKYYENIKSSIEFIFSLLLLIIVVPICILACIAIYVELRVNPIYTQKRVGLKRITKVGRIIRKTRIDELPQLVNILKRDMSFIGPRPERPEFIKEFIKYIPDFNDRLLVKPGITGWAQVNGGYSLTPKEKLEFDKYYIKNRGFKLDLLVLIKTIIVIFTRHGAR